MEKRLTLLRLGHIIECKAGVPTHSPYVVNTQNESRRKAQDSAARRGGRLELMERGRALGMTAAQEATDALHFTLVFGHGLYGNRVWGVQSSNGGDCWPHASPPSAGDQGVTARTCARRGRRPANSRESVTDRAPDSWDLRPPTPPPSKHKGTELKP